MTDSCRRWLKLGARLLEIQKNRLLRRLDPPTFVLLYHRVTLLPSDPLELAVSPDLFREQLSFLKARFPIKRFEDSWSKEPSIVITFDDGYADNYLEALPILEEVGVPATFFVSTGTIGSEREFWWDELERLILLPRDLPAHFRIEDDTRSFSWPTFDDCLRRRFYGEMQTLLKGFDASRREAWLSELRDWAGLTAKGRVSHRPMNLEELKGLAASPFATIGAHTITHTCLSNLSFEEQEREILGSKHQLQSWLGREIPVFSYPFGDRGEYDEHSLALCRRHFNKTASTLRDQAHSWNDSLQIPRLFVGDWPGDTLRRRCLR